MADLEIGREFAGWMIEEVIGRGGMGVVYRGSDPRLNRSVAIKLIASDRAADPAVRARFEREARLMASIDHPNVIPVYAAGEADGHLYLVMRHVPGTDLHHLLAERGRLAPEEAVRIVGEVAGALDVAHAKGLVHRDIKPANVLLGPEHAYLTDFGITRAVDAETNVTDSHERIGTLDFMSPEQLRGESTDARSDVYSLGCLLHTCLTGAAPFHRDAATATILAHISDEPPRPSATPGVPRALDSVLRRALAKRPRDRYSSAGALAEAARAAVRAPTPRHRLGRRERATGASAPTAVLEARAIPSHDASAEAPNDRTQVHPDHIPTRAMLSTPVPQDGQRRRRLRLPVVGAIGGLLVVAAAAAAVIVVLVVRPGAGTSDGPVTRAEVAQTVAAFSRAYGARSRAGLARVLSAGVQRVSPTGEQRGRSAVLAEYSRQFAAIPVRGYRVTGLVVVPGWGARAAGEYHVTIAGGGGFDGRVAFGLERVGGRVLIELIATEPSS